MLAGSLFASKRTSSQDPQAAQASSIQDLGQSSLNNDVRQAAEILKEFRDPGPLCGILSLGACLTAEGIPFDGSSLVHTDYVGTFEGSSVIELIDAAGKMGAQAKCLTHLTISDLQRADSPMILHVRSDSDSERFTHWIAFLGFAEGRIRIFDGENRYVESAPADLLANWDGLGIIVSKESPSFGFLYLSRFQLLALLLAGLVVAAVILGATSRWFSQSHRSRWKVLTGLHGSVVICCAAGVIALSFHALSPVGFFRNPTAVGDLSRRFFLADFPNVDLEQLRQRLRQQDVLLIDARRHQDFRRGTIPGAISVPVNSPLDYRNEVLKSVPRDRPIIVFCQSETCGYSDYIAKLLKFNSFSHVAVYRGGYREWQANPETSDHP